MKKEFKITGFILPMMLACIVIFSLLMLLIAEQNLLAIKLNQNQQQAQKKFYAAEEALVVIANKIAHNQNQENPLNADENEDTITIDSDKFFYTVYPLEFLSCAQIDTSIKLGVQFYRVILHSDNSNQYFLKIQADYAFPSKQQGSCKKKESVIIIKPGLQSWQLV